MLGNKAKNLRLLQQEINIPQFDVVDFSDFIENKNMFQLLLHAYYTNPSEDSFYILKQFIEEVTINFHPSFEANLYSVRSSGSIEDGESNSFAGQFASFLNVAKEELNQKIKDCFLSMVNENALNYMKIKGISFSNMEFHMIVQEMIASDISGVLFTCNPQGILNEAVITCGEGLGENVVSDKVDTTSYYYNLTDHNYYYEGEKNYLKKKTIEELLKIGEQIEEKLGKHLDIEFAIKDGKIYVLQARRITTIEDANQLILDNSNIVESYPGISLPLTISFVKIIYAEVFRGLTQRIIKCQKEVDKRNEVFGQMVGNYNGRLYYRINNWYELIQCLPFRNKIIPIWQEMLGINDKSVSNMKYKLPFYLRATTFFNTFYELKTVSKKMKKLNHKFDEVYQSFQDNFSEQLSKEETIALYHEIGNQLFSDWSITLLNDLYTFLYMGLLKRRLMKKEEYSEESINGIIAGNSNIESLKPIRSLIDLAYGKNYLSEEEFQQKKKEYIHQYGDRNVEELKLESYTFRTNPEILDQRIEDYLQDKRKLSELYEEMKKSNQIDISSYDTMTKNMLKKCKNGIQNREKSRLNRSKIFGMVRTMFLHIGNILKEQNLIEEQRDIFYLTVKEIFSDADCDSFKKIIIKRKQDYELFRKLPSYSRVIFANKEFDKHPLMVNREKIEQNVQDICGIACSKGEVEGEALVIHSIEDLKDVKDKILITKMTDPGWVFYLATCKGIISEKGSLLSHTAIISRELEVPAIVGVKDCTSSIKTGDIIWMNGNTGEIKIVKRNLNDQSSLIS